MQSRYPDIHNDNVEMLEHMQFHFVQVVAEIA